MGFFKGFKDFVNVQKDAFMEGYEEERERLLAYDQDEDDEDMEDIVFLCLISAGDRKADVVNYFVERMEWTVEETREFVDDFPDSISGSRDSISSMRGDLQKLGVVSYIVEPDERVYLKISSIHAANESVVTAIMTKALGNDSEWALEFLSDLPGYLSSPKECARKIYERLYRNGVEVQMMSAAEYEDEMAEYEDQMAEYEAKLDEGEYDDEYEDEIDEDEYELEITSAGRNKATIVSTIRNYTDMSLAEAKEFVDNLPQTLYGSLELMEELQEVLEMEGADAVIHDPDMEIEDDTPDRFCPSCGNKVSPTAKFCTACGARI